jgi:excisionase family DNA binding protein
MTGSNAAANEALLTVSEAAKRLGVGPSRIAQLVKAGRLPVAARQPPGRGGIEPQLFRRSDVDAYAVTRTAAPVAFQSKRRQEARAAVRAFELFAEGRSLAEVCRELEEPPNVVRRLYAEWLTPLGAAPPKRPEDAEAEKDREHRDFLAQLERDGEASREASRKRRARFLERLTKRRDRT